jgi:hypothetical protein
MKAETILVDVERGSPVPPLDSPHHAGERQRRPPCIPDAAAASGPIFPGFPHMAKPMNVPVVVPVCGTSPSLLFSRKFSLHQEGKMVSLKFRGRRVARMLFGVVTAVTVASTALATPALADGDRQHDAWSNCTKIWNYEPKGARFRLADHHDVSTGDKHKIVINSLHVTVDTYACGTPQTSSVAAYSIHINNEFHFAIDGTPQCSVGFPTGISCEVTASEIIITYHQVCQVYKSVCQIIDGHNEFIVPYAGNLRKGGVNTRVSARLFRNDNANEGLSYVVAG